MALINCPSCNTKISSITKTCPKCGHSRDQTDKKYQEPATMKLSLRRQLRNHTYRLRMFSYVAMSITMAGALPMLWDYIRGIEMKNPIILKEHWGMSAIGIGFVTYLILRALMIIVKNNYKKNLKNLGD